MDAPIYKSPTSWVRYLLPWYIPKFHAVNLDSIDEWRTQHNEVSATVRRILLVLLSYCFFCMLSLGVSDVNVALSRAETVKIPFANINVSFFSFVIIGPVVLFGLFMYLQVFVTYLIRLGRKGSTNPFVFNLDYPSPRILAFLLIYILPLGTLFLFTYRALPKYVGGWLTVFTAAVLIVVTRILVLHFSHQSFMKGKRRLLAYTQSIVVSLVILFILVQLALLLSYRDTWMFKRSYAMERAYLVKKNLQYANLENISLKYANLIRADLSFALVNKSNLTAVRANEANFSDAQMHGVILKDANLKGAIMKRTHLSEANFFNAKLHKANLQEAVLLGVNMENANLYRTQFLGADLRGVIFKNSKIVQTNFHSAQFGYYDFDENKSGKHPAQIFAGKNVKIIAANFDNATIDNGRFNCVNMKKIFTCIMMTKVSFNGTRMTGAQFKGVYIRWAKFNCLTLSGKLSCADLRGANFNCYKGFRNATECTQLHNITFSGTNLQWTQFVKTTFSGVRFSCVQGTGSQNICANLEEANLEGANFRAVVFEGADLRNANLSNAQLAGAKFKCWTASGGDLKCVDMAGVNLRGATMKRVSYTQQILRTDLRGVTNLTCKQLKQAKYWRDALRLPALACGESIPEG